MQTVTAVSRLTNVAVSSLDLTLVITDRNVLGYLALFEEEEMQCEKALEALKVGVIAIQSASPTLDTQVVQAKFSEVEGRLREQLGEFQRKLTDDLRRYFEEQNGVVPRSIDGIFGDNGALSRTFQTFFNPTEGKLSRLMQDQIGPQSNFGKVLDPQNKQGIIALMEARVQELVEAKLDDVLQQFSLDEDGSAMCRLKLMLSDFFGQLNQSLGIKVATAAEADRGHVKGIVFEDDLYPAFAELGRQVGDETELVRGTVGVVSRCKKGDLVATLGETSGAPGQKVVVEIKDQPLRLKDAIENCRKPRKTGRQPAGSSCSLADASRRRSVISDALAKTSTSRWIRKIWLLEGLCCSWIQRTGLRGPSQSRPPGRIKPANLTFKRSRTKLMHWRPGQIASPIWRRKPAPFRTVAN